MMWLKDSHAGHEPKETCCDAIQIKNVSFKYTKKEEYMLKDISIDIKAGQFTTILGPNGCGKSTLVKAIVQAHTPQEGEILVRGEKYVGKEFAKRVAYIPQMIEIPGGITVEDFVSFGRVPYLGLLGKMSLADKNIVAKTMKQIGVWEWKDKDTTDLSGGERQRVLVAMALAQGSEIIILDEPTTYLDIKSQYELLELMDQLHDMGKTIIVILHDINQAIQYSNRIVILNDGKLYAEGTPEEVITEKMLKEVYGVETKIVVDGHKRYIHDVKLVKPVRLNKSAIKSERKINQEES